MIKIVFLFLLLVPSLSHSNNHEVEKLTGANVLVVYKNNDAMSKNIALYYAKKRHVPKSSVVGVPLGEQSIISPDKFQQIRSIIDKKVTNDIKVVLFTWHAPYRVGCMSLTSAFTLGFDKKYCSQIPERPTGCYKTAVSPYFNKTSKELWSNENVVLSMMLSAISLKEAKKLIDRGVASDFSHPDGFGYLVNSSDKLRNIRWPIFKRFVARHPRIKHIDLLYIDERNSTTGTKIIGKDDVMFYFTGYEHVPNIEKNTYLPGAVADHLTSYGGKGLDNRGQMKIYRWLEAGVTGSYGTVIEPCNYPQKFSNPSILIPNYMYGDTLIEAYWKSVEAPGEGVFVGEPLASPWKK